MEGLLYLMMMIFWIWILIKNLKKLIRRSEFIFLCKKYDQNNIIFRIFLKFIIFNFLNLFSFFYLKNEYRIK